VLVIPGRRVELLKDGRIQAGRIPHEFEFPGEEAILRKEGDRLIIEPASPESLLAVLGRLATLEDDLPPIDDLPPGRVQL
jgi:antitoxin VapB